MADPNEPTAPAEPDHFFLTDQANRLADGGPRYKETPPDPAAVPVAEPWNAITASVFILLVLVWVWRLWGRFRRYPFLSACLPILLAGGVGGTLYHAFRTERAYFLLDVIPISLLGVAGSVYLTVRLGRAIGLWKVAAIAVGLVVAYLFVNGVLFRTFRSDNPHLSVNLSYASLVVVVLVPLAAVLVRTRFRYVGWVAAALAAFGHAWFCRLADGTPFFDLPMGTHWLWHIYGAVSTAFVIEYFYRIEGERDPAPAAPKVPGRAPLGLAEFVRTLTARFGQRAPR